MHAILKYDNKLDKLSKKELAEHFAISFQFSFNCISLNKFAKPITKLITFQTYSSNKENWYSMCKEMLRAIAEFNQLNYVLTTLTNMENIELDEKSTVVFLTYINEACADMCEEALSSNISTLLASEKIEDCDEFLTIIINLMNKLNELDEELFNPKLMNSAVIKDIISAEIYNCKTFSCKRFFIDIYLTCAISGECPTEELLLDILSPICSNYFKNSVKLKKIIKEFIKEVVN